VAEEEVVTAEAVVNAIEVEVEEAKAKAEGANLVAAQLTSSAVVIRLTNGRTNSA
jgi:hypothetical protein